MLYTSAPLATIFFAVTFISIASSACTSSDRTPVSTDFVREPPLIEQLRATLVPSTATASSMVDPYE
jgi:hypothetical protein